MAIHSSELLDGIRISFDFDKYGLNSSITAWISAFWNGVSFLKDLPPFLIATLEN